MALPSDAIELKHAFVVKMEEFDIDNNFAVERVLVVVAVIVLDI